MILKTLFYSYTINVCTCNLSNSQFKKNITPVFTSMRAILNVNSYSRPWNFNKQNTIMKNLCLGLSILLVTSLLSCSNQYHGKATRADHLASYKGFERKHQKAKIKHRKMMRNFYTHN